MTLLTRTIRDRPGNEDEIRGMEEENDDVLYWKRLIEVCIKGSIF